MGWLVWWGQEGYGDTGDRRGDSMLGALGTGRLMGLLGTRGVMGMLWIGGVTGCGGREG